MIERGFEERVQVQAILYGPHFDLHKRILESFAFGVPDRTSVFIWCNVVGEETYDLLKRISKPSWFIFPSEKNVPKYRILRHFMWPRFKLADSPWDWAVYFDDDSFIWEGDWWGYMKNFIEEREKAGWKPRYIAPLCAFEPSEAQWKFIRESYAGKPPQIYKGKPSVLFGHGAYFWIHREAIAQGDLPDPRINHNNADSPSHMNGDILIGEQLYQMGVELIDCRYGVRFDTELRRGIGSETDICPHCGVKRDGGRSFFLECGSCRAKWSIALYPGHTMTSDLGDLCRCKEKR